MTIDLHEYDSLNELLVDLVEGGLDAGQVKQFQRMLHKDQYAREQYIKYMRLHAMLEIRHAGLPSSNETDSQVHCTKDRSSVLQYLDQKLKHFGHFLTRQTPLGITLAAVIMISAITTLSLISIRIADDSDSVLKNNEERENFAHGIIATVTDLNHCFWADGEMPRGIDDQFREGELINIKQGLLEIKFTNGVTSLIEGPATMRLNSKSDVTMIVGKSTFHVPQEAVGFRVNSDSAQIVDLGTQFGVLVSKNKTTRVHVKTGSVEVASVFEDKVNHKESKTLYAGQISEIELNQPIKMATQKTVNFIWPRNSRTDQFKRWESYSDKLKKDEDVVTYYTFEKSSHLINQAEATQGRFNLPLTKASTSPTWSTGRWSSKSALSFEAARRQHLFISDWNATGIKHEITMSAWVKLRSNSGYQVVASCWRGIPYVYYFAFRERDNEFDGRGIPLTVRLSKGGSGLGGIRKSELADETLTKVSAGWVHIAFTVKANGGAVRLYKNGREIDTAKKIYKSKSIMNINRAWVIGGMRGQGNEYFNGLIDELVILKRAMTADEIMNMYNMGKP